MSRGVEFTGDELARLYEARFSAGELAAKQTLWQALCRGFFDRYVAPHETMLDLGTDPIVSTSAPAPRSTVSALGGGFTTVDQNGIVHKRPARSPHRSTSRSHSARWYRTRSTG